jgi:hypothetical protein
VKGETTVGKNALIVVFFFFLQSILLNDYDFTFATSADGVGMKTGATIHTMNGLNVYPWKISKDADPPKADGWWEKQHLKRGLSENGWSYPTEEDAVWQTTKKTAGHKHSQGGTWMPGSALEEENVQS